MTDLITLRLLAGDGGRGRVSFRREKYVQKGGPDGGDGGDGGNIILRSTESLSTLKKYAGVVQLEAGSGEPGGKKKSFGKKGADLILEVPVGTEIWSVAENQASLHRRREIGIDEILKRSEVRHEKFYLEKEGVAPEAMGADPWLDPKSSQLLDQETSEFLSNFETSNQDENLLKDQRVLLAVLSEPGQELIVCQGGFGGRGNTHFKGSTNTTPLEAEYETPGEKRIVVLELKLLADIGFVGYPNAGKSTLLSVLTDAKPKIANYPFTTLEPQLGIFRSHQGDSVHELVLADIPGLIAGASQGKGLGFQFLRHVENCSKLLYVLAFDELVLFDENMTDQEKAEHLLQQYNSLVAELKARQPKLTKKPFLVVVNKTDLYNEELKMAIFKVLNEAELPWHFISAATLDGIQELRKKLVN